MKAKQVTYSRLVSKGNYENEKIEVCIELEDGEKLNDAFNAAKKFVDLKAESGKVSIFEINRAKLILSDKDNHTGNQVKEAEEVIKRHEAMEVDELPF